jgi:hypothetical protein
VLEEETSGNAWLLTGLGLPKAAGMSAGGSSLFGADNYYQYVRNELCLISGGGWNNTASAGVWNLSLYDHRTGSSANIGLRCALYPGLGVWIGPVDYDDILYWININQQTVKFDFLPPYGEPDVQVKFSELATTLASVPLLLAAVLTKIEELTDAS